VVSEVLVADTLLVFIVRPEEARTLDDLVHSLDPRASAHLPAAPKLLDHHVISDVTLRELADAWRVTHSNSTAGPSAEVVLPELGAYTTLYASLAGSIAAGFAALFVRAKARATVAIVTLGMIILARTKQLEAGQSTGHIGDRAPHKDRTLVANDAYLATVSVATTAAATTAAVTVTTTVTATATTSVMLDRHR